MYVWDGWRCSAVKVLCIVMHSRSRCRFRAPRVAGRLAARRTPRRTPGFRFWWCWITIFWLLLALFKRRLDEKKMENRAAYTLHGGYISKQGWSYTDAIVGKHTSQLVSRPFSFHLALWCSGDMPYDSISEIVSYSWGGDGYLYYFYFNDHSVLPRNSFLKYLINSFTGGQGLK